MALSPAYAVEGGSGPASMFRTVAWAATNGSNGVIQALDLKVGALAVPGGAVNINPGGALMVSRYQTQPTQSYVTVNDAAVQLEIPPTGSSGPRTDYVILRIDDWHFDASDQPTDPANALYCSFERVTSLQGIAYPYVALAKITIPASTAAITSGMVSDLREVANPRTQRVLRANAVITKETEQLKSRTGEYFPNAGGAQVVTIPPWATRVKIRADWIAAMMPAGDCRGRLWVSFGDWDGKTWGDATTRSQDFLFDNASGVNPYRTSWQVVDDLYVPAKLRGRDIHFQMWGKLEGAVGMTIDGGSGACLDLLFEELADPSDS